MNTDAREDRPRPSAWACGEAHPSIAGVYCCYGKHHPILHHGGGKAGGNILYHWPTVPSQPVVPAIPQAELRQRIADVLYERMLKTGSGRCPSSWTGHWRDWYREQADAIIQGVPEIAAMTKP